MTMKKFICKLIDFKDETYVKFLPLCDETVTNNHNDINHDHEQLTREDLKLSGKI